MDTNTLQTSTSHLQLLSKCKKCTRKKSQTCHSNKWMSEVCSMMMELSMQSLIREPLIQSSAEMAQDPMLTKCFQKSTEYFLPPECTFASAMDSQIKEWDTSKSQNTTGQSSNTRLLNQLSQHLLLSLTKIRMRRTSIIFMSLENKWNLKTNERKHELQQ